MTGVAHLGAEVASVGFLAERPGFGNVQREGFLNIDMLAHLDCRHRGHGMNMVRRGDGDGVDLVPHFGQHFPPISEKLGVRIFPDLFGTAALVDIAERGDDLPGALGATDVGRPASSGTDEGHPKLFIGGLGPDMAGENVERGRGGARTEEFTAGKGGRSVFHEKIKGRFRV